MSTYVPPHKRSGGSPDKSQGNETQTDHTQTDHTQTNNIGAQGSDNFGGDSRYQNGSNRGYNQSRSNGSSYGGNSGYGGGGYGGGHMSNSRGRGGMGRGGGGSYRGNNSYRNNNDRSYRGGGGGRGSYGGGFNNNNSNDGNSSRFGRDSNNNDNQNNRFGGGSYGGGSRHENQWNRFSDRSCERNLQLETELFNSENEVHQGINFAQYDRIKVDISEENIACMSSFEESELSETLLKNIALCHFNKPTPIQKYAVPCVRLGKDVMACAQTGSGKTAAFLLPIIDGLLKNPPNINYGGNNNYGGSYYNRTLVYPQCVILSPTRELAIQTHLQARKFLYRTGFRSVVCYGGTDRRKEKNELRNGAEILVATPGRLKDYMSNKTIVLNKVQYLILDEGDRMLDMGFMPQIKEIILEMPNKKDRLTLMFSATFPDSVQLLAQEFLKQDYVFIAIGKVGSTNSFISQKLMAVENHEKTRKLIDILPECEGLTLIFVEKKRDAASVEKELIKYGIDAVSIHGDRNQDERESALKLFRTARIPCLVATDVAARGLDIPNVMYVINYDLPNNIDSYVHRIGRTGRCGNEGNAVSFVNDSNKPILKELMIKLKESKQEIPQWFSELVNRVAWHGDKYGYGGYGKNKYGKYNKHSHFGGRDFRRNNQNGNQSKGRSFYDSYNNNNNNDNNNNNNSNNEPWPQQQQGSSNNRWPQQSGYNNNNNNNNTGNNTGNNNNADSW